MFKRTVVVGQRGFGRTNHAVEWLKADPSRVLVVHSAAEKDRICTEYGVSGRRVLTYDRARSGGLRGRDHESIGIDNVEIFVQSMLGMPIAFMTAEADIAEVLADPRLVGGGG